MKKILLIALAVAVGFCLPLTAQAKTEFELGGFIRLDALWNSNTGVGHTLAGYPNRTNTNQGTHGVFLMNANATRLNLTIKGPKLWDGNVTGFIEFDFDGGNVNTQGRNAALGFVNNFQAANDSPFSQAKIRLRHAMFKIAWTDKEVIFGQFWSVNSEMIPETADSGAYCIYGATQLRLPQIRYTQKFTDYFNASLEIAASQNGRWGVNVDATNATEGDTAESPMVEGKLRYERDFYGKAGWYGKPRGFYIGAGGGWFRSRNVPANFANAAAATAIWQTFGGAGFIQPLVTMTVPQARYHDHWLLLIENFVPIIPTTTKSLSGTMSFAHQWWVGQGVSAWRLDLPGSDRNYQWSGVSATSNFNYDLNFIKRFGGWGQLQYYWTEEIYTNLNAGFMQAFNYNFYKDQALAGFLPGGFAANANVFNYANPFGYDPIRSAWRVSVTQWYRPVPAVKFALQYAYMRANYFQGLTAGSVISNRGEAHSLFFNAWYMF
jgi:hypothetical protein